MARASTTTRVIGGAAIAATGIAAVLRVLAVEGWQTAAWLALVLLGVRMVGMVRAALRRELPWGRLLIPAIAIESIGLGSQPDTSIATIRTVTAIGLELAFIVIAIRALRSVAVTVAEPSETRIARGLAKLVPPRVARLAAIELVILGSALALPFRRAPRHGAGTFTYHRESALRLILLALPLLVGGDILLVELVVLPHAPLWLRILAHGAALYGALWMLGLYATVRARPHALAGGHLTLHRGILRTLAIPVADIATIAPLPTFANDWKQRAYYRGMTRLDVAGAPALELTLHRPAHPIGLLGEGAATTRVLVAVDDPAAFTAAISPPSA